MSKCNTCVPVDEILNLIDQLQEHAENDRELLSKVKEPTLQSRLEGKILSYDYAIAKMKIMLGRREYHV